MIFLIDNYDSFVYNLARYFQELGLATEVARNDQVSVEDVITAKPKAVVLSPGPCTPREAGISCDLVKQIAGQVPLLGVCLGHQAIAAAFGASVIRAAEPMHGKTSTVQHNGQRILSGLPQPLTATRYHSLIVDEATLPKDLEATAHTDDRTLMAFQHRSWPVFGIQFHPESVLTAGGHRLLANFLIESGIEVGEIPAGEVLDEEDKARVQLDQPLHW
ncbi:MAG: aminodeoxychorismate/anthranilate synthase component II [Planctomycetaceae bacterium]|nr:aminodeoxychorismate/anthranilate synthase component II [Planctomycetaceae bacterium]